MINNVTDSAAAAPATATDSSQAAANTKQLVHTPFGDVMVDALSKPDFYGLFGVKAPSTTGTTQPATQADAQPATQPESKPAAPTVESVFGSDPWVDNPTGSGPNGSWDFNPIYFATQQTADKVASMVGGTVVAKNDILISGVFNQSAPNQMIRFADGREVNAGLIANFFNHGYPQSYIDTLLKNETDGKEI